MTIALAINTNEGAILATDSATTLMDNTGTHAAQIYNNAIKTVNLYKGRPFGVATYGLGNIGPYSITLLAKEFRETLSTPATTPTSRGRKRAKAAPVQKTFDPNSYKLSDVAVEFGEFIQGFYSQQYPSTGTNFPTLGFILTGYSSGERLPETYVIETDAAGLMQVTNQDILGNIGVVAKGQPDAINRLTVGISMHTLNTLIAALQLQPPLSESFVRLAFSNLEPLVYSTMPLQDSIDLARFLIETGIQFQRFKFDDKTVGGPIEIATMTRYEGFKWVQRKHYFDSSLNPS